MNHNWFAESRMVKPGVTPSLFAETTVHLPGAGPSLVFAPRATIAGVSGTRPARFTKYGPSGTSSMVLTFFARCPVILSPGRQKRFSIV